ncbi:MAG: hypothetical protein U9N59_12820, partial [Campylobacterota bacterium]|nr:hypothetical protein [Campylobacterota bacterium]
ECIRKDGVSLMLRNGDINISFIGLSSINQLYFEMNNNKIDISFKNIKQQQKMGQIHYIVKNNKNTKMEFDTTYSEGSKVTLMVFYALMVDVEIINYKLYFRFYINENRDKYPQTTAYDNLWKELDIYTDKFIFFKDDKALEEYNIYKKDGYYFKDNKPVFDKILRV